MAVIKRARPKRNTGFVYFIGCQETLRLKIGYTAGNPYARLAALQTGSPTSLILAACQPGSIEDEKYLHEKFHTQRVRGEWFNMCDEIFEHISMVVWLEAASCAAINKPLPEWARNGLSAMNEERPLPDSLAMML